MRGLFKVLGKGVIGVVKLALPAAITSVMPEAVINTAVAGVAKHTPVVKNGAIPYLNLIISIGIAYVRNLTSGGDYITSIAPAITEGATLMGMSTALHQSVKLGAGKFLHIKGKTL